MEKIMQKNSVSNKFKGLIRFTVWGFFAMCFLFVQNFFYHIYYTAKYKHTQGKAYFWKYIGLTVITCNIACIFSFWDQAKVMVPKIYRISQYY